MLLPSTWVYIFRWSWSVICESEFIKIFKKISNTDFSYNYVSFLIFSEILDCKYPISRWFKQPNNSHATAQSSDVKLISVVLSSLWLTLILFGYITICVCVCLCFQKHRKKWTHMHKYILTNVVGKIHTTHILYVWANLLILLIKIVADGSETPPMMF